METCDVIVVGGGPAGSTCARNLRESGLDVVVVDKAAFPRDKTCAGWITPQVIETLQLDIDEYSAGRVFQPITGFYVALLGRDGIHVGFEKPVSFGIRRCEFDEYLLRRSGARLRLNEPVTKIEKTGTGWRLNGTIEAPMLVGAGGHFCPVARQLRAESGSRPQLVTAVEAEFPFPDDPSAASDPSTPRLYFRDDLSGYGWCVRKRNYFNIGVGLVDSRGTASEIDRLLEALRRERAFADAVPVKFKGHAYYLYDGCRSKMVDNGVLLIGDAAGLAYRESGEGIRPAIESGVLAAQVIAEARGQYDGARLQRYQTLLAERLGRVRQPVSSGPLTSIMSGLRRIAFGRLVRSRRFVRNVVLQDLFLHANQPALIV